MKDMGMFVCVWGEGMCVVGRQVGVNSVSQGFHTWLLPRILPDTWVRFASFLKQIWGNYEFTAVTSPLAPRSLSPSPCW